MATEALCNSQGKDISLTFQIKYNEFHIYQVPAEVSDFRR